MEDSSGTAGAGGEMRNEKSAQKYLLVDLLELKQISYDGFYIKVYPFIICYFLEIPHGTKVSTLLFARLMLSLHLVSNRY